MKLLYITNSIYRPAGLERVLSVRLNNLIKLNNYEINIITLNQGDIQPFFYFDERIKIHDIQLKSVPTVFHLNYIYKLRKKIIEINPDITVVCDDGIKAFVTPFVVPKKLLLVYERHASLELILQSYKSTIIKNILKKFILLGAKRYKKFVVLTSSNKKEWNLPNTVVIPNPLPFYPDLSSDLMTKKIIAVGANSFNKGYDLLLKSWNKIYKLYPEWELNIYGNNNDKTYIQLAEKMNLDQSVHFHDATSDIIKKYLNSAIHVLTSRSEGFGMVIIEAMSCGLPVVSFDCPHGPGDIITDGVDGFLVENGNTEIFAEKLELLINNYDLRVKLGKAGKINVKKYLPENNVKQWNELFKTLHS